MIFLLAICLAVASIINVSKNVICALKGRVYFVLALVKYYWLAAVCHKTFRAFTLGFQKQPSPQKSRVLEKLVAQK